MKGENVCVRLQIMGGRLSMVCVRCMRAEHRDRATACTIAYSCACVCGGRMVAVIVGATEGEAGAGPAAGEADETRRVACVSCTYCLYNQ